MGLTSLLKLNTNSTAAFFCVTTAAFFSEFTGLRLAKHRRPNRDGNGYPQIHESTTRWGFLVVGRVEFYKYEYVSEVNFIFSGFMDLGLILLNKICIWAKIKTRQLMYYVCGISKLSEHVNDELEVQTFQVLKKLQVQGSNFVLCANYNCNIIYVAFWL
jgi:hypothetical protein